MVLSQMQPDIAAPGVSILAATTTNKTFNDRGFIFLSGTSMAAPTISGVVALLKALHRDWSPAAIRSAIVTTGSYLLYTMLEKNKNILILIVLFTLCSLENRSIWRADICRRVT